jgi:predicted LPLAT superfamily acyltransferase
MERRLDVKTSRQLMRNPGPSWGFAFLQGAERLLPWPLFRILVGIGVALAVACMPEQRCNSRDYLAVALGRPPGLVDLWRHFYAYADFLLLKLRVARGVPHQGQIEPTQAGGFAALMESQQPAFFGSFHFGRSDLLGYLLGGHFRRRVFMVRLQIGNAADSAQLGRLFGEWVTFIWVNQPENLLFALKDAVASGGSLAMQCDRLEFTAKTEAFEFLGARRLFPFTIYHLAVLFERPVIFCLGLPGRTRDDTVLHSSPTFAPDPALRRAANLQRAREHFQAVLTHLEGLVRQHPYLWFNFLPLNPVAPNPPGR